MELHCGTLDMLILKIVALGPSHGYAIAHRLRHISNDFFTVHHLALSRAPLSGRSRPPPGGLAGHQ
jgi:DNA-binding PadR family transcriptional regulator